MKNRKLVYDWPLRIFHWLFALLFATAFIIAKNIDDESPVFFYHMLAGMLLSVLVFERFIWGFIGTRYSHFSSFDWHPKTLFSYFIGIFQNSPKRWPGHNPATSWAAIFMMICALGLGISGYLMTGAGLKENLEDVHEILANSFLVLVAAHIAGIVVHTIRFRDWIALSMLSGTKSNIDESDKIESAKAGAGVIFLAIFLGFALYLYQGFDPKAGNVKIFGSVLSLGEGENEQEEESDSD
jgi:cytochrome b